MNYYRCQVFRGEQKMNSRSDGAEVKFFLSPRPEGSRGKIFIKYINLINEMISNRARSKSFDIIREYQINQKNLKQIEDTQLIQLYHEFNNFDVERKGFIRKYELSTCKSMSRSVVSFKMQLIMFPQLKIDFDMFLMSLRFRRWLSIDLCPNLKMIKKQKSLLRIIYNINLETDLNLINLQEMSKYLDFAKYENDRKEIQKMITDKRNSTLGRKSSRRRKSRINFRHSVTMNNIKMISKFDNDDCNSSNSSQDTCQIVLKQVDEVNYQNFEYQDFIHNLVESRQVNHSISFEIKPDFELDYNYAMNGKKPQFINKNQELPCCSTSKNRSIQQLNEELSDGSDEIQTPKNTYVTKQIGKVLKYTLQKNDCAGCVINFKYIKNQFNDYFSDKYSRRIMSLNKEECCIDFINKNRQIKSISKRVYWDDIIQIQFFNEEFEMKIDCKRDTIIIKIDSQKDKSIEDEYNIKSAQGWYIALFNSQLQPLIVNCQKVFNTKIEDQLVFSQSGDKQEQIVNSNRMQRVEIVTSIAVQLQDQFQVENQMTRHQFHKCIKVISNNMFLDVEVDEMYYFLESHSDKRSIEKEIFQFQIVELINAILEKNQFNNLDNQTYIHNQKFMNSYDFVVPCKPVDSGGTAGFQQIIQTDPNCDVYSMENIKQWIGKDFERSADEIHVYEKIKHLRVQDNYDKHYKLLNFCMEYQGLLRLRTEQGQKNLLLLRNFKSIFSKGRFIDLKLGDVTGIAGWKGKSVLGAFKNFVLDTNTNSAIEGYRLENCDNPPEVIISRDYNKQDMQKMQSQEFLSYIFDFKDITADPDFSMLNQTKKLLIDLIAKLFEMLELLYKFPHQKWIGSSLAIVYELNVTRDNWKNLEPQVKLFDWGRSVLHTVEEFNQLEHVDKADTSNQWYKQIDAISRLIQECTYFYYHKFCMKFNSIEIKLLDQDQKDILENIDESDDLIGTHVIDLGDIEELDELSPLKVIKCNFSGTQLYLQLSKLQDNLQRIVVDKATGLSICLDQLSLPDGQVQVDFKQNEMVVHDVKTAVVNDDINPVWNENIDFELKLDDNLDCLINRIKKHFKKMNNDIAKHVFATANYKEFKNKIIY